MRVLTWNINSLRLRLPLLKQVVDEASPDLICLQETKVIDELFPAEALVELGYPHHAFRGIKSYNGVAILSKIPFQSVLEAREWVGLADARHVAVTLENGVEVHNFYVPAGGDIPDPQENPKYAHKLQFVEEMREWFITNRKAEDAIIIVGDLNIAPLEQDVWSHKQLLNVVSHTPPEVERLNAALQSIMFSDVMRDFVPEAQKLYSWWSYRGRDWKKSDRGRRLDHIWATAPVAKTAKEMQVMKAIRGAERPSDHAPVWVDFEG